MEKYSKFRDESTGIAPFQEARPQPLDAVQTVLIWIFGVFSSFFSLIDLVIYFFLVKPLLPAIISRIFLNYAVMLPLRVLYITFSYEGEHRASVRQTQIRKAQPGDILLSNFTSPLDPLIYESQQKTHFAMPTLDGRFESLSTSGVMCRALSLIDTDKKTLSSNQKMTSSSLENSKHGNYLQKLSAKAAQAGAVLVVFVEGTTTNGRGLLTLKHLNASEIAELESHVYPAAIRYTPAAASAPVPSSFIGYVWQLSHSAWFYMASVRIAGQPLNKNSLNRSEISKAISVIGRLRILGDKLDAKSKQEYVEVRKKR